MADPKEDLGKYPAEHEAARKREREAALAGEAPGGKTGQLGRDLDRDWSLEGRGRVKKDLPHPTTYGRDDRQKYLQDVAARAFEYMNPEQGPLTAYQAARGEGEGHREKISPYFARKDARADMSERHKAGVEQMLPDLTAYLRDDPTEVDRAPGYGYGTFESWLGDYGDNVADYQSPEMRGRPHSLTEEQNKLRMMGQGEWPIYNAGYKDEGFQEMQDALKRAAASRGMTVEELLPLLSRPQDRFKE